MPQNPILVLYYSNGVDVFGPVHRDEFSKNKYYQSTLIWYEGLDHWIPIGECEEFRHLIGTLPEAGIEITTPLAIDRVSPPLPENGPVQNRRKSRINLLLYITAALLMIMSVMLLNIRPGASEQTAGVALTDSVKASLIKETESGVRQKTYRNNWAKFITLHTNDFKKKELGGIKDLKVSIRNNSPYGLDSVKVKLEYKKSNGDVYLSEELRYDLVPAHGGKELFAPNSNRGVEVSCRILSVHSREMEFCYEAEKSGGRPAGKDPYHCRDSSVK